MAGNKARTGLADKVASAVVKRHAAIQAVWFAVLNDPRLAIETLAPDFFIAVGDILEGKPLDQIHLGKIDKGRVAQHIKGL